MKTATLAVSCCCAALACVSAAFSIVLYVRDKKNK